ncbi:MAG TPA: type VI secretion system-associated protein TagF [Gemmatimonadaceae bacterium]|jgi:type VI secretion system protein ImpM
MSSASFFPALCFGKLPLSADFIRHNAGGREVLAFDQWLQQGMYHARNELRAEWESSYRDAPAYQFVFFPENSESLLLGVLHPSHDRSERHYPFIVCLQIDRRLSTNRLPLIPMLFASFLDGATRLVEDARQNMSLQQIVERTEALRAPVDRDYAGIVREYETSLAAMSPDGLREYLWPSDGNERASRVFKNLIDILVPLRGHNAARLALGLRFPLPLDVARRSFTASFWLLAACASMGMNWPRPFFFWTAPSSGQLSAAAFLFLFLRQPSATSVLSLLRPDLASDAICAVDVDGADVARSALPARLAAAVSARDTNLLRLLDVLGGPMMRAAAGVGA